MSAEDFVQYLLSWVSAGNPSCIELIRNLEIYHIYFCFTKLSEIMSSCLFSKFSMSINFLARWLARAHFLQAAAAQDIQSDSRFGRYRLDERSYRFRSRWKWRECRHRPFSQKRAQKRYFLIIANTILSFNLFWLSKIPVNDFSDSGKEPLPVAHRPIFFYYCISLWESCSTH